MNKRRGPSTVKSVLQSIKRFFRGKRSERPILLRVEGVANGSIEVEATWFPSGLQYVRNSFVSQGMCIVPWMMHEDNVRIRLRAQNAFAELKLSVKDTDDGRALSVVMVPNPPA